MAGEHGKLLAVSGVPDARGFVVGRSDNVPPVGRVRSGFDVAIMTGEHHELFAAGSVPDACGLVVRTGEGRVAEE